MPSESSITGFLSDEELKHSPGVPSEARRRKGPVATIECLEDIPCNPCESSCNVDAIFVGEDITNIPHLDGEKCVACRTCVYICPGQAIFYGGRKPIQRQGYGNDGLRIPAPAGKGRGGQRPGSCRSKIRKCNSGGRQENPANGSDRHRNH